MPTIEDIIKNLNDPGQLKLLLDSLDTKDYQNIVAPNSRNHYKTIFHHAIDYPASLKILLDFYPIDKRFDMVMAVAPSSYSLQKSVFDTAILKTQFSEEESSALEVILDALPKSSVADAVNSTRLCDAARENKLKSLKILLKAVPEDQRRTMIEKPGGYSRQMSLLYHGIQNPSILLVILENLPENERAEVVQKENKFGSHRTGLQNAVQNRLFKCILRALPENQRLEIAIKVAEIVNDVEKMKDLLSCLPENKHIDAIQYYEQTEKTELFVHAIGLQKRYCNDPAIRAKTDEVLRLIKSSPELKKRPEVSLQLLEATHKLLEGTMSPETYNAQAEKVLCNPKKYMQILGGAMIALGLLVAVAAAATLVAAPVLPVAIGAAVSAGVLGTGLASLSTWKGIGFFNEGSDPYVEVSDAMEGLSNARPS